MADDDITIKLKVRDAARFIAEMGGGKVAIEAVGDAAKKTRRQTEDLEHPTTRLSSLFQKLSADGDKTASSLLDGVRGLSGWQAAAAGAVPAMAPLIGGIAALGGSLAAAAGGAAALGLGAGGVFGTGFLGLGLVAGPAASGLKDITTALDAYNLSVDQYGKGSRNAITAQQHLNAVVAQSGGPNILRAAQAWDDITERWKRLTSPATGSIGRIFTGGLGVISRIEPTLASVTNRMAATVQRLIQPIFRFLGGGQARSAIREFGSIFDRISRPLSGATLNLLRATLNIATAAAPALIPIARMFEGMAGRFARWTSSGGFRQTIGLFIGNLRSWFALGASFINILLPLIQAGAGPGKTLIDGLTGFLNRIAAWERTRAGKQAINLMIRDAVVILGQLAQLSVPLLRLFFDLSINLLPSLVITLELINPPLRLLVGLLDRMTPILTPLAPLIGAIGAGFVAWKTAGLVAAGVERLARAMGFLAKTTAEEDVAQAAGGGGGGKGLGRKAGLAGLLRLLGGAGLAVGGAYIGLNEFGNVLQDTLGDPSANDPSVRRLRARNAPFEHWNMAHERLFRELWRGTHGLTRAPSDSLAARIVAAGYPHGLRGLAEEIAQQRAADHLRPINLYIDGKLFATAMAGHVAHARARR